MIKKLYARLKAVKPSNYGILMSIIATFMFIIGLWQLDLQCSPCWNNLDWWMGSSMANGIAYITYYGFIFAGFIASVGGLWYYYAEDKGWRYFGIVSMLAGLSLFIIGVVEFCSLIWSIIMPKQGDIVELLPFWHTYRIESLGMFIGWIVFSYLLAVYGLKRWANK